MINKIFFTVSLLMLAGCSKDSDSPLLTTHEVYSNMVVAQAYPTPINKLVAEMTASSDDMGMYEFYEIEVAISKNCLGKDWTWKHELFTLPYKALLTLIPLDVNVLAFPEYAIVKQVDFAHSCIKPDYFPSVESV